MMIKKRHHIIELKRAASLVLLSLLFFFPLISFSQTSTIPLAADQAFELTLSFDNHHQVSANWHIAPGYYLYKERFKFSANNKKLTPTNFPQGEFKYDTERGRFEVFSGEVFVPLSLSADQTNLTISISGLRRRWFLLSAFTKKLCD